MIKILAHQCFTPGIMTVKTWIREGSRSDPSTKKGLHQLCGSVLSRGCGPYGTIEVADLIEGCGASLRSETHEDGLLISLKCSTEEHTKLLPLIGWMIASPHLEPDQIDLERELCIQVLKRQIESPFHLAFNSWRELVYSKTPYGHDPCGTVDDLLNITHKDIQNIANMLLLRPKVIVLEGALPVTIEDYIQTLKPFKTLSDSCTESSIVQSNNHLYSQGSKQNRIVLNSQKTSQIIIIFGKETIPHSNLDDLKLRILSCYLGSGMSSLLFKKLREEKGLVYDVGTYHPIREYNTPFAIHASTTETKARLTLEIIIKSWNKLINEELSHDDLKLAKAKLKGNYAHNSQTISQRAERKAQLLGYNMDEDHDSKCIKRIDSITSQEINRAAQKHLRNPCLSLCGPKSSIDELALNWRY